MNCAGTEMALAMEAAGAAPGAAAMIWLDLFCDVVRTGKAKGRGVTSDAFCCGITIALGL